MTTFNKGNTTDTSSRTTAITGTNNDSVHTDGVIWTEVESDASYYKMDHRKQGYALIFNHETFSDKEIPKRIGTDIDMRLLKQCLHDLHFEVNFFKNPTKEDIDTQVKIAAQLDHSDCNCFLIAVLSHGDKDLLYAYDDTYDPNKMFIDRFTADKCPALAGKPKLLIMQCCQGERTDPGIQLKYKLRRTETDGDMYVRYTIPVYADFLIMYATYTDHFAFRNNPDGSCYIREFCKQLRKYAYKEHILTILTIINRRVAIDFVSNARNPKYHEKKQIPFFKCSLTRLLQFVDILKERENEGDKDQDAFISLSNKSYHK